MRWLLTALTAAIAVAAADPAAASCGPTSTEERLRVVAAAVVGTVESVRSESGGSETVYTLRVERTFKGAPGERVEVRDRYATTTIALRAEAGDRLALLLDRDSDGTFRATDCLRTSEEALEDASRPRCRASGTPSRRYGRRPPEGGRYRVRPRVVGCGRTGGTRLQLVGYRRARGGLCLDVGLLGEGISFGCGDARVAGPGPIEVSGQYRDDERRLLTGTTGRFVDAVRVEYALDGGRVRTTAEHMHVDDARVLRRLRVGRAFGFYVVEVPARATEITATALAWHGGSLGSATSGFD